MRIHIRGKTVFIFMWGPGDFALQINGTVLAVFGRFLMENADRMEDLFNQMDKDKSGDVTLEELKYGLKDFGLRLTSVRWTTVA